MTDDAPDDRERAAAAALARALAGEPVADAPADAVETAALLRYARAEIDLDPARSAALREQTVDAALRKAATRRKARSYAAWTLAIAAGVAAGVLTGIRAPQSPTAAPMPGLASPVNEDPSALARLLEVQGQALLDPEASLSALAGATAKHRAYLLSDVARRQGGLP